MLLTDIVMPGMTGRELARQLRDIYPRTKVLFTSGNTDAAVLHNGLLDKDTYFIGKPYGIAQLNLAASPVSLRASRVVRADSSRR